LITTPIGILALLTRNDKLIGLRFCRDDFDLANQHCGRTAKICNKDIQHQVECALKKYFDQQIPIPKFPFELHGTPFQKKVWQALCKIPFGQMRTYGELAELLNTSAQAIGNACRENPIPIIIPCHRVVSRTGWGGYCGKVSGSKIQIKTWLLQNEGTI